MQKEMRSAIWKIQECWEEGEKKGRGRAKLERKAMEPKDEIAA